MMDFVWDEVLKHVNDDIVYHLLMFMDEDYLYGVLSNDSSPVHKHCKYFCNNESLRMEYYSYIKHILHKDGAACYEQSIKFLAIKNGLKAPEKNVSSLYSIDVYLNKRPELFQLALKDLIDKTLFIDTIKKGDIIRFTEWCNSKHARLIYDGIQLLPMRRGSDDNEYVPFNFLTFQLYPLDYFSDQDIDSNDAIFDLNLCRDQLINNRKNSNQYQQINTSCIINNVHIHLFIRTDNEEMEEFHKNVANIENTYFIIEIDRFTYEHDITKNEKTYKSVQFNSHSGQYQFVKK